MKLSRYLLVAIFLNLVSGYAFSSVEGLKSCVDVKKTIHSNKGDYIVDGLEIGLRCFNGKEISRTELRVLINDRLSGITRRNPDALRDMSIYMNSYLNTYAGDFEREIGRELLDHIVNQKIKSKGRYEFLLAVTLLEECCVENRGAIVELLGSAAEEGNILAAGLLTHLYQGNICFERDPSMLLKYEIKLEDLGREQSISLDAVIEYLDEKDLLN